MDGAGSRWTTVHRQSQANLERLSIAEREAHERQLIREWEASEGHWSGMGKHTSDFVEAKKLHVKIHTGPDKDLGWGTYGHVEKVVHRTVTLARKRIHPRRNRTIEILREEAHVMERLDHEHIVKLVGTYCYHPRELYLLIWPVAVCNLAELMTDLEDLRSKQGDRADILRRLEALNLRDMSAIDRSPLEANQQPSSTEDCPFQFLQRITGCIGQAVTYCHKSNIRHLDLKPTNILLNPNRVYLADFGIARDVNDQEKTTTFGQQGTPKWRAPEIYDIKDWSMKSADIYSLGLIYLNIATLVYNGNLSSLYSALDDLIPQSRAEKLKSHQEHLALQALATQRFVDDKAATFAPKHIVSLTSKMLATEPLSRPRAEQVDTELVILGGIDQLYHNSCCRKSSRLVTKLLDSKYAVACSESRRMHAENEALKKEVATLRAKDETYQMRHENQEKTHAKHIEMLKKQLDRVQDEKRKLEERIKELESSPRRHRTASIRGPHAAQQTAAPAAVAPVIGLGLTSATPTMPAASAPQPLPTAARPLPSRIPSTPPVAWTGRNPTIQALARPSNLEAMPPRPAGTPSPVPNSPNTNLPNYPLRSRGSGSRLPVAKNPATPLRSSTPNLLRDPSMTDSTQASLSDSIYSRRSIETKATSVSNSPAIGAGNFVRIVTREVENKSISSEEVEEPHSPVSTAVSAQVPPSISSVVSSPRTTKAELASVAGSEDVGGIRVPSLQPMKSWAAVAGEAHQSVLERMAMKAMPPLPPLPQTGPHIGSRRIRGKRPFSMYA